MSPPWALLCLCGSAGAVSPQKAGKCVWAPVVTSGGHSLLFYLPYYRRGWVRAHPELFSLFLAVEELGYPWAWIQRFCAWLDTAATLGDSDTLGSLGVWGLQEGTVPPPGLLQGLPHKEQFLGMRKSCRG